MNGLHENASWDLTNKEQKEKQRNKSLEALELAKAQEKNKKGRYVRDGNCWRFVTEKTNENDTERPTESTE